jgi:hypothetical protein
MPTTFFCALAKILSPRWDECAATRAWATSFAFLRREELRSLDCAFS